MFDLGLSFLAVQFVVVMAIVVMIFQDSVGRPHRFYLFVPRFPIHSVTVRVEGGPPKSTGCEHSPSGLFVCVYFVIALGPHAQTTAVCKEEGGMFLGIAGWIAS